MVWGRERVWFGAGKAHGLGQGKGMIWGRKAHGLGQAKVRLWFGAGKGKGHDGQ